MKPRGQGAVASKKAVGEFPAWSNPQPSCDQNPSPEARTEANRGRKPHEQDNIVRA